MLSLMGLAPGCGTLVDMHNGVHGRRVFGGVRKDIECLVGIRIGRFPLPLPDFPLLFFVAPIDLPLSFVADVILLPVTIVNMMHRGDSGPPEG